MAFRNIVSRTEHILFSVSRIRTCTNMKQQVMVYSQQTPGSKGKGESAESFEEPVQFSHSKAAEFSTAESVEKRGRTNRAKYEAEIVRFSLGVFLIYFLFLREESDLDEDIGLSLFDRLPELELVLLRNKRKMASSEGGEPFSEADRLRLQELEKELSKN